MKRYVRKIASITLASLIISSSLPLYASEAVTLQVDGMPRALKVAPVLEDGITLVGLREIFEVLGATVNWDEDTGAIKAKTTNMELSLIPGIKIAKKNGIPVELTTAPKQIDGNTMVPLRFVSEAFGAEVNWDEINNTIIIDTTSKKTTEIQETKPIEYPTLNIVEEGTKITYEEAIEKALKNSLALKNIEESIKISEETQENARDAVIVHRPPTDDYASDQAFFVAEAAHINALLASTQADYGAKAAKYQKEIQEGIVKYQVKASFDSIQNLKKDIELSSKSLETAKKQLDITNQKANLGLESNHSKTKEEQDYQSKQKKFESLKKSLDNEYIKLNRLMGIDEKERASLDYTVEFTPIDMSQIQLNAHIERALVKDPSIILKGEAVKQAEYNLRLHTYTGGMDSWDIKESKRIQAINDEIQAKNDLRDKIRTTYNQIKQLEEQYQIDTTALQQAKEQYDILKTQYDLGMVIELNLKQAELAILSAQAAQEKTALRHAQLIYLLNNPYLL